MLALDATGLEVLVLAHGGTCLVVALVVAATTIVAEHVLLALAMMTTRIVAVVASSVQSVAPALVGDEAYLAHILFFSRRILCSACSLFF